MAAAAYSETDRKLFTEIAATLDREAAAIERALSRTRPEGPPPSWMVAPPFREI